MHPESAQDMSASQVRDVLFRREADMTRRPLVHRQVTNDPGCVKTHTSAKCRKYNSPTRHRTSRAQHHFDSMMRNFFEMFLRARRALEFSHSQDPKRTKAGLKSRTATDPPVVLSFSVEARRHWAVKRRELITLLGAAAAWPVAARAQQTDRVRRVGLLVGGGSEKDAEWQALIAAFKDGLRKLGWTEGQNIRIDERWPEADVDRIRAYAAELVNLQPDVIVAGATSVLAPLTQATRTIPIVFAQVSDPVRGGFVKSLAHPEGNVTGFALYEYAIAVKWLELLKQIAPRVTRVAVIYNPTLIANAG